MRGKRSQLNAKARANAPIEVDFDIKGHFKAAIDYLDQNYAYFLTRVLNIGTPEWSSQIDTACVTIPKSAEEDFKFLFNPDFAQTLSEEEMAFVLAHETMHILFNHIRIAKDYPNHQLFNVAADCCINDLLVSNGLECPESACRGMELVGFDCATSTVAEVYEALKNKVDPPNNQNQKGEKGDGEPQDGEGSGESDSDGTSSDAASALQDLLDGNEMGDLDDHTWLHEGTEEQAQEADQLFQDAKDNEVTPDEIEEHRKDQPSGGIGGSWAGRGTGGMSKFMEEHGVSLQWAELLKELDPDIFKEPGKGPPPRPSYHRPRRKMQGFYPDVILPVYRKEERKEEKNKEKPVIVMALDTSGSISRHTANRFITLARSIPKDKVKLHVCTFTTVYRELDLEKPQYNSGGTNFAAIEDYIQAKVMPEQKGKKYPKAVLVVTDGHADFWGKRPTSEQQEKSWYWLLAQTYHTPQSFRMRGRKNMLEKFIGKK